MRRRAWAAAKGSGRRPARLLILILLLQARRLFCTLAGLLQAGPGNADEPFVGRLGRLLGLLAAAPRPQAMLPPQPLGAPCAVAEEHLAAGPPEDLLGLAHQPAPGCDAIVEQAGVRDVGLDHRGIGSELSYPAWACTRRPSHLPLV